MWTINSLLGEFNGFLWFKRVLGKRSGFASYQVFALVAQWIEQLPSKQKIAGSSPAEGAISVG